MNNNKPIYDERQKEISTKALAISGIIQLFALIMLIIYKVYILKQDIAFVIDFTFLLFLLPIIILYYFAVDNIYKNPNKKVKDLYLNKFDDFRNYKINLSLGIIAISIGIYSIIMMIFEIYNNNQSGPAYIYLGLSLLLAIVPTSYSVIKKEFILPTTWNGKSISPKNTEKDKKGRLIHYAKNAIRLSIIFLIIDIFCQAG